MSVVFAASQYASRTANLPSLTAFTICAWGKATSAITANTWRQFLSIGNTSGSQLGFGNDNALATNNWGIVNNATGHVSAGTAPGAGVPFFAAMTVNGTGPTAMIGYYRLGSDPVLAASSTNAGISFTVNAVRVGTSVYDGTDDWLGSAWNVKCWDRVLTLAELQIESYFRRVMFPDSINFHWPLDRATDVNDYSGLARAATLTGSPTTGDGSQGLLKARHKTFFPVTASVPGVLINAQLRALQAVNRMNF